MRLPRLRKKMIAVTAGLAISGVVGASAASLGGLGGQNLGADTGSTGACDTDGIEVDYVPRWNPTREEYDVGRLTLSHIDLDCRGLPYSLTIVSKTGGYRAWIDRAAWNFGTYDAQPGPGVDRQGRARYLATFPADDYDGIAIVVGDRAIGN